MPRRRFDTTPGQQRQNWRAREHEADQLVEAETRAFVAMKSAEGMSLTEISGILQVSTRVVKGYLDRSISRVNELHMAGIDPKLAHRVPREPGEQRVLRRRVKRGPGAGPHRANSEKALALAPKESDLILHKKAYDLRKRALPFDEIGQLLGITESEARKAVRQRVTELDSLELESADESRNIMVAQIDSMMAALMPDAIGTDYLGAPKKVIYEAVDRMVKLMDAKAKLLGLNSATKVDMTVRLKEWASQAGYDFEEVADVAAEVISSLSQRR